MGKCIADDEVAQSTKKRLAAAACFGVAAPLGFFGLLTYWPLVIPAGLLLTVGLALR